MSGAGGSLGLLLGGVLTDLVSWRWVLFVNVPIGVVVALLAPRMLPAGETRPGRLDLPGALSVTAGMTTLVYGFTRAATAGWSDPMTIGALSVSVVLLAVFLRIEATSTHALMPLRIFSDRSRAGAYAVMLGLAAGMFGAFFFMSQYVQDVLGYSPLKAGLAFLPMTIGIGATANVLARLVGRTGNRAPMVIGPALGASGLFWLSFAGVGAGYASVVGPILLIAVGMGTTFLPLTLTVMSRVQRHEAGLASALLNAAQQIGGSLGLAILVTVATSVTAAHRAALTTAAAAHGLVVSQPAVAGRIAHQALTSGYDAGFRIAAVIAFGAFVVAALVARRSTSSAADAPAVDGGLQLELAA